jgi:hypothetical protein
METPLSDLKYGNWGSYLRRHRDPRLMDTHRETAGTSEALSGRDHA